jgi:K+-transporting ATPase A subunit
LHDGLARAVAGSIQLPAHNSRKSDALPCHRYRQDTPSQNIRRTDRARAVASQEAIKMLGTNGGGFFNANSAHPFENPSAASNLIEMVAIFAIGAGLTNVFGRMAGDERQGPRGAGLVCR